MSRGRHRPLTGSKGVGRLAVQFLATDLVLETRAQRGGDLLTARVDWAEAVESVDLTKAKARYTSAALPRGTAPFPGGRRHGTTIRMSGLRHEWTSEDFIELAREIWALQPPFGGPESSEFRVELNAADENLVQKFDSQMRAWLHLWHARLRGRSVRRKNTGALEVELSVEFEGESPSTVSYVAEDAYVHALDFEIRVFSLHNKQRYGIRVGEARDYLRRNGGVHIYDAGFHLPYYGPETDWLRIEADHSHRLSRSPLLPDALQVTEGLNYLPTNARLYGVVNVDTGAERSRKGADPSERLEIQMSRDRLVGNKSFEGLTKAVRWALDYYAMEEARRSSERAARKRQADPLPSRLDELEGMLGKFQDDMSPDAYSALERGVKSVARAGRNEIANLESQAALLGSLATAGMSALAIEHEVNVQLHELRQMAGRLQRAARRGDTSPKKLEEASTGLLELLDRIGETRRLFAPLLDEEDRERRERLKAREVIEGVVDQCRPLMRGIPVVLEVADDLLLPEARLADWSALFQNVFVNAVNAMLDAPQREIVVRSKVRGRRRSILVEDTGAGVDLSESEELFEPFVRRTSVSSERRMLGLGGSGLGLAIVRLIATNSRCVVGFTDPDDGYSTAFELIWTE